MRQEIINTPSGSGLGDTLAVAFDKVNTMTEELYSTLASISGSLAKTKTSEFTNDGQDGSNPFITLQDIPTSWSMESITGLMDALSTLQLNIDNVNGNLANTQNDVAALQTSTTDLTNQITAMNLAILNQNQTIAALQNQINNL